MTNDNCHFPPHTLSAKLCSKLIIIYNIYIIYNNDIIFIIRSSPEYDTVICHICHLSPVAQVCPDIFLLKNDNYDK